MGEPIAPFTDGRLWPRVYNQQFYAEQLTTTSFSPIPPVNVPVLFTSRTIAVALDSQEALSHWWLGIRLKMRIAVPGSEFDEIEAQEVKCQVNRGQLIRFPRLAPQYTLRLEFPWWHSEMRVTIWEFQGTEQDSTEVLIKERTDAIRVDLARVEAKIDQIRTTQQSSMVRRL